MRERVQVESLSCLPTAPATDVMMQKKGNDDGVVAGDAGHVLLPSLTLTHARVRECDVVLHLPLLVTIYSRVFFFFFLTDDE